MQITPPFGYQNVVPFQRTQRVRLPAPGEVPAFARNLNAIPISFTEFTLAGREYPLVFTTGDNGKTFAPVAVLGVGSAENLFLEGDSWRKGIYVPAYARRFPFCMAKVNVDQVEQQNRLICIEKANLDDKGEALFDDKGEPSPKWKEIERLLSEYEADLERSREMCAILADYALLEPFTMQAKTPGGQDIQLSGMHRVAEAKIEHLNASQLRNLVKKGILGRMYLHLVSLDNFARLLQAKMAA